MLNAKLIFFKIYNLIAKKSRNTWMWKRIFNFGDHVFVYNVEHYTDEAGLNFKKFILNSNMPQVLSELNNGLDTDSKDVINQKLEHIMELPTYGTKYHELIRSSSRRKLLYTDFQNAERLNFCKSLPSIKQNLNFLNYAPEVVFYHHGLKLLDSAVTSMIRGGGGFRRGRIFRRLSCDFSKKL